MKINCYCYVILIDATIKARRQNKTEQKLKTKLKKKTETELPVLGQKHLKNITKILLSIYINIMMNYTLICLRRWEILCGCVISALVHLHK